MKGQSLVHPLAIHLPFWRKPLLTFLVYPFKDSWCICKHGYLCFINIHIFIFNRNGSKLYILLHLAFFTSDIGECCIPAHVELPRSFTWLCSIPYVCMLCHNFLNKSSMEDDLRCLQYFAITKDAIWLTICIVLYICNRINS